MTKASIQLNPDQKEAIHHQGENILVAASAGSGKTFVLVERILNHLESRFASIDELLVVTFTELAAKEMKERLENRIKEAVNEASSVEDRRFYLSQMQKIPTAHIRTLHSFCLAVIEKYFYLIDFNPSFDLITDETELALIYQEVWEQLLDDIYEEESWMDQEQLFDLLARYTDGKTDEGLYELVVSLYQFSRSHPNPQEWLKEGNRSLTDLDKFLEGDLYKQSFQPYLMNALMSLSKEYDRGLDRMQRLSQDTIEKYEPIFSSKVAVINQLYEAIHGNRLADFSNLLQTISFQRWPSNSKKSDDYEAVNELKDIRDNAKKSVESLQRLFPYSFDSILDIEHHLSPVIDNLIQLTIKFQDLLMVHKRGINRIDYSDLEHLTLEIIAPFNPETQKRQVSMAGAYYQDLFQELLIDEYQDINEIQGEILNWLSREYTSRAGNQFKVGDVKQSIYGFRMADPDLFLQKYRSYQKSDQGHLIVLDENYRSRHQVLQFTNFVFERLMDETFGNMPYDRSVALKTGNQFFLKDKKNEDFNIRFLLHSKEDDQELTPNPRMRLDNSNDYQSFLIAQDIYRRVHVDQETVYDKDLGDYRPVTYGDFVVLSSTRNPFLSLQRAFEHYEIPLMSQKNESFFQRQEIQLMLALLKIIDNPLQDIPLVAILRSFFVGLSDESLSQIRIYHPDGLFFEAVQVYLQGEETEAAIRLKLSVFMKRLLVWQEKSKDTSLVDLIWDIYQETFFLDYVGGLSNGIQRQANLHAFYEKAKAFDNTSFTGLFGFIQYIEKILTHDNDLSEPIILGTDDNFVRSMTVHASKGLEFPVVYLMKTEQDFNMTAVSRNRYTLSKEYGVGTDLYDYEELLVYRSLSREMIKISREQALKEEEMRKLYVALTRCEQQLTLVGTIDSQDKWANTQEKIHAISDRQDLSIDTQERQSAKNWLTWLCQALAIPQNTQSLTDFHEEDVIIEVVTSGQIQDSLQESQTTGQKVQKEVWMDQLVHSQRQALQPTSMAKYLDRLMNVQYDYGLATRTSSYQSVSELKRLYKEPPIEKLSHFVDRRFVTQEVAPKAREETNHIQSIRYTEDTFRRPDFMEEVSIDAAMRGTITHFVMQGLSFKSFKSLSSDQYPQELERQIQDLVAQRSLEHSQVLAIDQSSIIRFLDSETGQYLMDHHQNIRKEQAFSLLMPAQKIFQEAGEDLQLQELSDDQVLIHGVIDLIVETPQGLLLLDYKTDRFRAYGSSSRQEQLAIIQDKYRFQMSLYQKAIELSYQQPVIRTGLVLLDFDQTIALEKLYKI